MTENLATPAYDAAGNMTVDPQTGKHFVYDPWNRLVYAISISGTLLQSYEYDALGRHIIDLPPGFVAAGEVATLNRHARKSCMAQSVHLTPRRGTDFN
jgi:hypothetical protein